MLRSQEFPIGNSHNYYKTASGNGMIIKTSIRLLELYV